MSDDALLVNRSNFMNDDYHISCRMTQIATWVYQRDQGRMMRQLILVIAFFLVPQISFGQDACISSEDLSCDLYTKCIEGNCNCGDTSSPYSATFGPKYCSRFGSATGFSTLGKEWRDKTLVCLKSEISVAYVANSDASGKNCNCSAIQSAAVDSHSHCYLSQPSFCKLHDSDIRVLARIVDAGDLFALGIPGMTEMGHALASCYWNEGLDKGNLIATTFVSETLVEGTEVASTVAQKILTEAVNYAVEQAENAAEGELRRLYDEFFPTGPRLQ